MRSHLASLAAVAALAGTAGAAPTEWPRSCELRMKALRTELARGGVVGELSIGTSRVQLTVTFEPEVYYWLASVHTGERDEATAATTDRWHLWRSTEDPRQLATEPVSEVRHAGPLEARLLTVYPDSARLEQDKRRDAAKRDLFVRLARAALDDCLRTR